MIGHAATAGLGGEGAATSAGGTPHRYRSNEPPQAACASASSSAISTSNWRALRLLILGNALTIRTEPEVCRKPNTLSAPPLSSLVGAADPGPPKKNEIGTSSASEMRCRRPAPILFTPFSYFWT